MAGYAIREWPVLERPRERLLAEGAGALATRELLAILIGSGREGTSAIEVAYVESGRLMVRSQACR